jgi:hypothetical protein
MKIYHVDATVTGGSGMETLKLGVCALDRGDAARIATERVKGSGWATCDIHGVRAVSGGCAWDYGQTIIY